MNETSPPFLRRRAMHLRQLARSIVDEEGQKELLKLAAEYDARAAESAALHPPTNQREG